METELLLKVTVEYDVIPSHEGTTDEIIPETINIKSVKIGETEIIKEIHPHDIENLEILAKENEEKHG